MIRWFHVACLSSFLLFPCLPAMAAPDWTQPTPDELKMTSDAKAPGAPAEYLNLEISTGGGSVFVYGRIKIFTEKGKNQYSDIRMDYIKGSGGFEAAEGRTIHADGTIIPLTGKPYNKELISYGGISRMQFVFSMPEVEVGSILEFRCTIRTLYSEGGWYIQQPIFVRHAKFHYHTRSDLPMHTTEILPPGVKVTGTPMGGYDLEMDDIPPLPDEEDAPPMHSQGYRVLFQYSEYKTSADYWKNEGRAWSGNVNDVASASGKLKDAVDRLLAPGDTDAQKVEKIYAAVMKLENTSFTRERTAAENKAEKIRTRTAADIWQAQRGDRDELALLFVAMVRSARIKAYLMLVTDRSSDVFSGMCRTGISWTITSPL